MNKGEFVARVSRRTGKTKKDTEIIFDEIFESLSSILSKGEQFRISSFGSFSTKERAAYTGHDPRTGEPIEVPSAIVPVFKPSQLLKDRVKRLKKK